MKRKSISYAKWGYIFIIPFFVVYAIFSLIPLAQTFYYSFIDIAVDTGTVASVRNPEPVSTEVNNGFCGLDNFKEVIFGDENGNGAIFTDSLKNTLILWIIGFIPQIVVSLLLAVWFTDIRLRLKGQRFFKTIIYLPNVIMASAITLLFYSLFAKDVGQLDCLLKQWGFTGNLLNSYSGQRAIVGFINFLMWYGNTTILLMAAIMGIDVSLYEAAQIDGANPTQTFWQLTIPLIKPILAYVLVTSMIGGLQMYDVPSVLGGSKGSDALTTLVTMIQKGKDSSIGTTGALSVLVFVFSAILGFITLKLLSDDTNIRKKKKKKKPAKA